MKDRIAALGQHLVHLVRGGAHEEVFEADHVLLLYQCE